MCIAGTNSGCARLNLLRQFKCTKAKWQGALPRIVTSRVYKLLQTSEYRVYLKSVGLFSSCLHEGRQTDRHGQVNVYSFVRLRKVALSWDVKK